MPACPFCSSGRVCPANSLRALYPQTAAEWHPKKNDMTPDDVVPFAKVVAYWKCEARGHVSSRRVDHQVEGWVSYLEPFCPITDIPRADMPAPNWSARRAAAPADDASGAVWSPGNQLEILFMRLYSLTLTG